MERNVSRRSFLAGFAATGAVAALGLAGCSPSSNAQGTAGKGEGSGSEASWKSRLNVDLVSTLPGNTDESVDVSETKDCDVVVIGAGCSGTNTAIRAAEAGLSVILVEKTSTIGGASLKSWAPSIPNSRYAKAAGVSTDTEALIKTWVADSHWRVDASAVRQLVTSSGQAVDWMSDNGWNFTYLGMGADITMLPDYAEREGLFRDMLSKSVETNGEILTNATAKHLVVEDGTVTGVVVADENGTGTQINARAVVIATGGYGANAEMVKTAFGFEGVFAGVPQNIGEGLEMGWAAGAQKPENFGGQMLHQTLAKATDRLINKFDALPAKYPMILTYIPQLINVGTTGVRFRDETLTLDPVPAANSSVLQGAYHLVIVSKDNMDVLESQGLAGLGVTTAPGLPPEYNPDYELTTPWAQVTEVFDAMVDNGDGFKGDTFEELAQAAGLDEQAFTRQISEYEEFCSSGEDTQFGKVAPYLHSLGNGPYYAIVAQENNLCSWGGLLVDADYRVLDDDRKPLPGLYAVGNEAGGNLYNDTYVGFGYGMANTITSGYLCGTKLGEALA